MNEFDSRRQILRSSSIIGGASLLNIVVGLIRTKVLAVLLGPSGVGLVGLLVTLMTTVASVAAMGFGTVGTRQIAEAVGREDAEAVAAARRALFWGTLIFAGTGGVMLWLLRSLVAEHVLSAPKLTREVGWMSLGVALTVAAGSQVALLNGLRRIGDMARLSVLSGLLSTFLGLGALWLWGASGLIAFVLATPLASFLLGHYYVSRLSKSPFSITPMPALMAQWRTMVKLGAAFMLTGLIWNCGHLITRTLVQRELGSDALGNFQAAWSISMTYIGFVLQAMGADYYPRLTASIHDQTAVNRMVNQQTEVALLLAGPAVLAMLGLAPWVIEILYTDKFVEAAAVLRWQIFGDILRIVAWPLGYVILASGDSRKYLIVESSAVAVLVASIWLGLPFLEIEAAGVAFLILYLIYLPVLYWMTKLKTGFRWTRSVVLSGGLLLILGAMIFGVALVNLVAGAVVGIFAASCFGIYSLTCLSHMTNVGDLAGRLIDVSRKLMIKIGILRG